MRSASSPHTKQKALKSADFKAFGAAGQIRLHFFSLAGDREKKSRYSPVFALAHAGPTGACVHDSNLPAGQIRTATAHSACALYPVMPDPLAQKVGSSNTDGHEKSTAGPLGLRCFSGAAGQIRTATAHSAYALYPVMPDPLGFASLKRSAVRILTDTKKAAAPMGRLLFWSCWADSNCRPHPYQGCALPTELQQQSTCPF